MTLFGLTLSITALRFGKNQAREAHRYMERAVDTTRQLISTLGIDCDYEHPRSSSSTGAPSRGRPSRSAS
jgi:GH18 family chitinase